MLKSLIAQLASLLGIKSKSIPAANIFMSPEAEMALRKVFDENPGAKSVWLDASLIGNIPFPQYDMGIDGTTSREGFTCQVVGGFLYLISRDDVPFLDGLIIQYDVARGAFHFDHPHKKMQLLKEYRALQKREAQEAAAQRKRDCEVAKDVVPEKIVHELLGENAQEVYDKLHAWWRCHSEEPGRLYHRKVENVQVINSTSGHPLYVVYRNSRDDGSSTVFDFVDYRGRYILPYGGMNVIEPDDIIRDVNGDGIPELVKYGRRENRPDPVAGHYTWSGQWLVITPFSEKQESLLILNFGYSRNTEPHALWRWSIEESPDGYPLVVLYDESQPGRPKKYEFKWSPELKTFQGPSGGSSEGFIAVFGHVEPVQHYKIVDQFIERLTK
ncbi:hypothetical protein Plim_1155 [Planctopirus limnophila DSM 3776]|uniref:Uncharacterized protein n=1 Tax=Planctopirus limnophila (strain ATCC 43296 / DSM 3776 / IFAM 1008 / Mu 290) TaxID=521674 RepID=D5SU05_PLAL2|nr:hypothetical protein [Planctopirus limnophila]ADG66990.1 hypothetical protein Plim_1155 [Planctopirus limnophila DSM 3776]